MKALLLLILTLVSLVALGQSTPANTKNLVLTESEYNNIANRFVTSLKETQVDSKLLEVDQIREITEANKITIDDIKSPKAGSKPEDKRENARKEFEKKFSTLSDEEVEKLSASLNLDSYGLVAGKERAALSNFFASRIEKALYGQGSAGEALRLKDSKIVDHKVYNDLYTSQLGKTILLELSNYCYNTLYPAASNPGDFDAWADLVASRGSCDPNNVVGNMAGTAICVSKLTDVSTSSGPATPPAPSTSTTSASATPPKADPYKDLSQKLGAGNPAAEAKIKNLLTQFMNICPRMIPHLCEINSYCLATKESRTTDAQAILANSAFIKEWSKTASCPTDNLGANSCVVQSRLKAYRTNLAIAESTEKSLLKDYADTRVEGNYKLSNTSFYNQNDPTNSIETITSISATDVSDTLANLSKDQEAKFKELNCDQNPESKECEAFFYNEDESVKFQNAGMNYDAATELEKKKIDNLKTKDKDTLKKYLNERGYADLADKVDSLDAEKIVAMAKSRFEAERKASYSKMEEAFEKRQILKDGDPKHTAQTNTAKADFQKGNDLNQLLIFNNIISSYLTIEKQDGSKIGNSRLLEAERQKFEDKGSGDDQVLKFFDNLAGGSSSSGGSSGGSSNEMNGNSIVNIDFLDQILADKDPTKKPAK